MSEIALQYRASGKLIAFCPIVSAVEAATIPSARRFLVLVQHGQEYVVSGYINGEEEWISGTYRKSYRDALAIFLARALELNI